MDYFIPIVGKDVLPYFREVCIEFDYAIIPYYEVYHLGEEVKELKEINPDIKLILSSIMPDEYLERPETLEYFVKYAEEVGFDYILAWDLPTYLDDEKESWRNTRKSIETINKLRRRFKVIPLVKGAYPEQKRYACEKLIDMGFEYTAIHGSPYLSINEYIGDYLEKTGLHDIQYTYDYLRYLVKIILEYPFKEVLIVGGGSPRHAKELLRIDPDRIRLAGYSWYIDSGKYMIYDPLGNLVDIRNSFYECSCRVCSSVGPRMMRTRPYMALHNLLLNREIVKYYAGEESEDIEVKLYDLILETYEDLLILNDITVGARFSLWRSALDLAEEVYPDYLLLTGSIIDSSRVDGATLRKFIEWIKNHREIKIILLWDIPKYHRNILVMLDNLLNRYTDLIDRKIDEEDIPTREALITLILTSKWSRMKVKKETWNGDIEIEVELTGPTDKPLEKALEELSHWKKHEGWLITDYIDQPYIDREHKIATPGRWATNMRPPQKLKPGAIHITQKGEIKIIKKENPFYILFRSKK